MPRLWLRKKLKKLLPKPKLPLRLLPKPLPLKKLLLLPKKKQNKIVSIFLSERVFCQRTPSRVFLCNSHAGHDSLHFSGPVVMLSVLCEMGDGVGQRSLSRRGLSGQVAARACLLGCGGHTSWRSGYIVAPPDGCSMCCLALRKNFVGELGAQGSRLVNPCRRFPCRPMCGGGMSVAGPFHPLHGRGVG